MTKYYEYEEHIRRVPRDRSPSPADSRRDRDRDRDADRDRDTFISSPRSSFHRETLNLEPPPSSHRDRPRSVPPPDTAMMLSSRSRGRSPSPSDRYYESRPLSRDRGSRALADRRSSRDRSESPLSKAKATMDDNFTRSTAGIGASLLGAVAGGWAARQAGETLSRRRRDKQEHEDFHSGRRRRRSDADGDAQDDKIRLASTILGAAIGGLGANALANRFEDSKVKTRAHQDAWEDKWGSDSGLPHYDSGRREDLDHRNGRGLPPVSPRRAADDYDDDDEYDVEDRYGKRRGYGGEKPRFDDRYDDRRDDRYDDRRY